MSRLLFVDGTGGFEINRIKTKPIGGILNSLTIIPQYLASKGHEVYVSCTCKKKVKVKGVTYLPHTYSKAIPKWDVTIFNRNTVNSRVMTYSQSIGAKTVWWLHDLVDFTYLEDGSYKHLDKIIALSQYCKKSYSEFYDIPEEKFAIIPNGIDKSIFYPGKYEKRKKYKVIMASALIKGYIPVELTWNNLKRQIPEAELYIYSSQKLHGFENNPQQTAFLERMEQLNANVQQPVKKEVMADIMRSSWIMLMPNSYPEICSNLLLEARACGLPVVSTNIGANPEFIENGKTGIITEDSPHDLSLWVKKYITSTVSLCKNDKLHHSISENAPQGILDWNDIGEKWNNELEALCSKE